MSTYMGPGNVAAANGFSHAAWYGLRAYSAATVGQPLVNVCVSGVCSDMFSSGTGDLVPKTINNVPCPNTLGNCLVQKMYDLTGNGYDLIQTMPASQPSLQSKALPLLGNTRACVWFPDTPAAFLQSTKTGGLPTAPLTFSTVVMNNQPGNRTNNQTGGNAFVFGGNSGNGIYFQGTSSLTVSNQVVLFTGSYQTVLAYDHTPHAIQATTAASGSVTVDGITTGVNTGTTFNATDSVLVSATGASRFIGVLCEAGLAAGDQHNAAGAMNANQTTYWLQSPGLTPVTDFTQNFDSATVGTVDLATMTNLFGSVPTFIQQYNYIYNQTVTTTSGGNSVTKNINDPCGVQSSGFTTEDGGSAWTPRLVNSMCSPSIASGSPGGALLQIVSNGKTGNGLQMLQPAGFLGFQIEGLGAPQAFFFLSNSGYNTIDMEWDEFWPNGMSQPTGVCGGCNKVGLLPFFHDPNIILGYNAEQTIFNTSPVQTGKVDMFPYNTDYIPSCASGGAIYQGAAQTAPNTSMQFSFNTWYHWRVIIALGPNGFARSTVNTGTGEQFFNGYARGNAACNSLWLSQNPNPSFSGFDIIPHYGGTGTTDAPAVNSPYIVDNVHLRTYNR